MDLVLGVVLVGSTIAASWAWRRYRLRLLTVGRRSARFRRVPPLRVDRRSTAWARADQPEGPSAQSPESSEPTVSFRAGNTVDAPGRSEEQVEGTRESLRAVSHAGINCDWRADEVQRGRTKAENGGSGGASTFECEAGAQDEAIQALEAMLHESHRALARERERVTVLEKKGSERAREAQLLRDEVRSLDAAIGHLNERLIDAQRRAKSAGGNGHQSQATRSVGEADQSEPDAATVAELERRAGRIVALEQRTQKLSDDLQETHTRYRQREQHIDRLEKNIAEFAKQVQQRDQRVTELVHSVRTAERLADAAAIRARDLQGRVDETPARAVDAARIGHLEATLAAREERISRLSRAFRASRRQRRFVADDLKRIRGIGPAIERKLRSAGIERFAQVATMTAEQIAGRSEELASYARRIERGNWSAQARHLMGDA